MPLQELTREFAEAIARQHPTLQTLSLARNALTHVPFLELLPPLRRLDLSANAIGALPAETTQWGPSLAFLDLSDNALESLQQLRFCCALVTLRAGGNRIALFSELTHLQSLEQLQELTLEGNPIASQPFYRREVVAMLPQVQRLDGRVVMSAERLVASLQQKPLLTTATGVDASAPLPVVALEDEPLADAASPALDLSGASNVWSAQASPLGHGIRLPSPSYSPSSIASSPLVTRSPRRPLLTPALLSQTTQTHSYPRPVVVDAAIQVASGVSTTSNADHAELATTNKLMIRPKEATREPVALLQRRISALESILELQDKMLTDELTLMGKHRLEGTTKDPARAARLYTQLLAAWRHKAVALMVQLKSLELQPAPHSRDDHDATATATAIQEVGRQLDIWKQKCTDALAQRDLERIRAEHTQRQCLDTEKKIVRVVRTLAAERERVQTIAEQVAMFAARDGVMTTHMDALAHETHRLQAFETRLRLLSERLQLASRLVAHREARLRNSEAAIQAERRIAQHKQKAVADMAMSSSRPHQPRNAPLLLLRPATEEALRFVFHRLDPYHTGLVATSKLLQAMRLDLALQDALGSGAAGESKRSKLVAHMEKAIRERSPFGGISGTLTWGEVLLLFMPTMEQLRLNEEDDRVDEGHARLLLTVDELGVPRRFEDDDLEADRQKTRQHRKLEKSDKQTLQALSKPELIAAVMSLRDDRAQLQLRLMEDAQRLQQRLKGVEQQWARKVDDLVHSNEELHQQLQRHTARATETQLKLEDAERTAGEAQFQLQSLRRQLSEQAAAMTTQKRDLDAQRVESVEREQLVWQRELQDMAFQQTQLQSENAKLELTVRQLERELAKQRDQREQNESIKVQHLDDKLRKRDDEIAKLRRERNTILNTLREHERKLAQQNAAQTLVPSAEAATQTAPPAVAATAARDGTRSTGVQVTLLPDVRTVPPDRRMRLDEIAPPPPPPPTISPALSTSIAHDLRTRLQHLETLTESLLAD